MGSQRIQRTRGLVAVLLGVAVVTAAGGCQMNKRARTVAIEGAPLPDRAPLAVDIDNRSGSVTVRVDPNVTAPLVTARPASGESVDKTKPWAAADLAQQEDRWVLRVITGAGETAEADIPVIVTVVVPACEGVRVKNAGGPVALRGVGGAITVNNTDLGGRTAGINVTTARDLTAPVLLASTGGNVHCVAGPGSLGKVTLMTPSGHPELRSRSRALTGGRNLPNGWEGSLGSSENPITLSSDRGDVTLEIQ